MGATTGIQWTDATWNPTRGCSPVSPGCAHCYAEQIAVRFGGKGQPYEGTVDLIEPKSGDGVFHGENGRVRTGVTGKWNGKILLVRNHLEDPLRWKRPRRIFVDSMSDLFHENTPEDYIDAVFSVMEQATQHTFQVLTKRHERMRDYVNARVLKTLPNVWLGVSVENQAMADHRLTALTMTPAAVRFISAEPLLGPIDLRPWVGYHGTAVPLLQWVIVGGESGRQARPFDIDWGRTIIAQCQKAGVPVFMKQLGRVPYEGIPESRLCRFLDLKDNHGGDMVEWPEDLRIQQFPKGLGTARA